MAHEIICNRCWTVQERTCACSLSNDDPHTFSPKEWMPCDRGCEHLYPSEGARPTSTR